MREAPAGVINKVVRDGGQLLRGQRPPLSQVQTLRRPIRRRGHGRGGIGVAGVVNGVTLRVEETTPGDPSAPNNTPEDVLAPQDVPSLTISYRRFAAQCVVAVVRHLAVNLDATCGVSTLGGGVLDGATGAGDDRGSTCVGWCCGIWRG